MTLTAEGLGLSYGERAVVEGLDVAIPRGRITAVVGPNACGKSTLLRGLGRLITPAGGRVRLDETDVRELSGRELARRVGVLPQSPTAPDGITVADLVERGRAPHRGWFGGRTKADDAVVAGAMAATATVELADRPVDELSGGQRQRVWIAMVLAQDTPVLLLDEPTTYLDMAHAVEVLDLLVDRNRAEGTTVVVVLHDLAMAARYADHIVAMRDGAVVAEGAPSQVVTPSLVSTVFGIEARVVDDPVSHTPLVVPVGRHHTSSSLHEEAQLREIVDPPHPIVVEKVAPRLDATAAAFVAASPLVLLASVGADGAVDVSPRGDPPGAVLVLDEGRTVALADRAGNRRLDSARNIIASPAVALLFTVPGVEHVLRVNGRARIVDDPAVLARWTDLGGAPHFALLIDVEEQFVHCGRALKFSGVWDPARWPDTDGVPGLKELVDAARAVGAV